MGGQEDAFLSRGMSQRPDRRYREGISLFRKYRRRFEKLKARLERKLVAGTFYQLPVGAQRTLLRRYQVLKARLERLWARILRIGGIAGLSLAQAASQTHATAPNPLELSNLDGSNGFIINGIDPQDRSGISVSGAGDVNGDGFDDVIIGAHFAAPGDKSRAGESYLVFGKASGFGTTLELSSLDGSNGLVIKGIDADDNSGKSVSSAGDVNGDGFDDIIIGGQGADPGGRNFAGESYVVFGQADGFEATLELSSLDGSGGFVINGIDSNDSSGSSVGGAGDVNGDGFDDIIIGAVTAPSGGYDRVGESYLVFGQTGGFGGSLELSSLDGSNGFIINGIDGFDYSGRSVSSAGDVNGDGFDDLIIGVPDAEVGGDAKAGESYVVFGKADGFAATLELSSLSVSNGFVINGIDGNNQSGYSVSSAGDVNGDGFDDLIIGAFGASFDSNRGGESYIVFGHADGFGASLELSSLNGINGFAIIGIDNLDRSGYSVSGAGDMNGDGFDDLIIGALQADPGGRDKAGESYVIFGGNFTGVIESPTVLTIDLSVNGEFELQFIGVSGVEYTVEHSTDLENWNPVTSFIGGANSEHIVDDGTVGQPDRFYRVRGLSGE